MRVPGRHRQQSAAKDLRDEVDAYELHAEVGRYFDIGFIRPEPILANVESLPGLPDLTLPFARDSLGRLQFPGYLLHA
jgi:hypothetical protein